MGFVYFVYCLCFDCRLEYLRGADRRPLDGEDRAMTTLLKKRPQTVTPSEADSLAARDSSRRLAPYLAKKRKVRVQVVAESGRAEEESLPLPAPVLELLFAILTEMAEGN